MSTASQSIQIEGLWEDIVTRSEQFAGKRVRITVLPEAMQNAADVASEIAEHDVVRVRRDVQSEGYSLREGMMGAVVSVYGNGAAFAVEFPNLDKGSAVVTLNRDEVEEAGTNG